RLSIIDACSFVSLVFVPEIPYTSPVPTESYGSLALLLLLSGLTFLSIFFTNVVAPKKNFFLELVLAIVAAFLLGFGSLFLFLWAEIYV
uniref:Dolichyl-diphosphooligosaccharide-protein glycosyltransferase subunit OST5 n=1 Tax=Globisporangium ultimum (strain ATCC 200006 / CBS 805.95 / DAOM BR144) TaxID=431595 RepID=K3WSI7_GLOUD